MEKIWPFYFPEDKKIQEEEDIKISLIQSFFQCLKKNNWKPNLSLGYSIPFNFNEIKELFPKNICELIQEQPEISLNCLGLSIYQLIQEEKLEFPNHFKETNYTKIIPQIYRFEPVTPLRYLKSNWIGKLVSIKGTVVRVGNIKPICISMNFQCNKCETIITNYFKDGKYKTPSKCINKGCKSKSFIPDLLSAITTDWQKIRIQEQLDHNFTEPGRVPRTIECELSGSNLVDSCVPGDVVKVTGIVKVVATIDIDKLKDSPAPPPIHKKDKNKSLFLIYIDANSIENNKQVDSEKLDLMQFTPKEMQAIKEISEEKNIFKLIINSICPGIYGHEIVKAGLTLALFGGCQKFSNQKNKIPIRGDSHILIVGDPGLGKSQMLTSINHIAPRGVYVCGSYSSSTGLTVSLLKEGGSGDYALEAGALVLADQGCCCIDEFDKMSNEHQALMEAMEQQSVSIAKAGIVCNLPARTSVIAAANPVGGHYNLSKTVCENLKMNAALLSRFDLIFILLDKPDEERDQMLSEHVISIHDNSGDLTQNFKNQKEFINTQKYFSFSQENSFLNNIRVHSKENFEPIHPILLRKYIGYAKKYVNPSLTPAACKIIQQFYLSLRKKHRINDSTPITTRQLESLIRLSEARARLELREEVTENDAKDVIEIMKESLFQRFEDEYGNIDFRRSSGMSKSKEVARFISQLQKIAENDCNSIFTLQQLQQIASEIKLNIGNFEDFIDTLNTQNYLLKKGNKTYKLMTTKF